MMDQVNSEWSHKQDPLTGGTNSTYLSDPLPCTGSVVHTAGDVLPGLYTGENVRHASTRAWGGMHNKGYTGVPSSLARPRVLQVLHIAIVSLNVDMVRPVPCLRPQPA